MTSRSEGGGRGCLVVLKSASHCVIKLAELSKICINRLVNRNNKLYHLVALQDQNHLGQ